MNTSAPEKYTHAGVEVQNQYVIHAYNQYGTYVGFIGYIEKHEYYDQEPGFDGYVLISFIQVDEEFRRYGYGTMLVEELVGIARRQNLALLTGQLNGPAYNLLKRLEERGAIKMIYTTSPLYMSMSIWRIE